ncbi:MAG TPA: hypothetical protein ENI17_09800 [Pseudomonas xinjiangensis]|uniref:Transcriptional regulator n=2 Tax=root TaxID=1 RepID=A0A7V1BR72_9GAMM|nr:hypothetical protein [Halopseudomonas xinjiangensis]HEC47909.1 hypothetical protein [Halopseudomonas xinjiangensis]
MTKLAEFRAAERKLAEQLSQLENIKQTVGLQEELDFSNELKRLMDQYGMSIPSVLAILKSTPER